MEISLGNTPIWILRSGGGTLQFEGEEDTVVLSSENPGPIEIDYDSLSETDKYKVLMGLLKQHISSPQAITLVDKLNIPQPSSRPIQQQEVEEILEPVGEVKTLLMPHEDFNEKATKFLSANTTMLRIRVAKVDSTAFLRTLLAAEKNNRNRRTVVKLLEEKLFKLSSAAEKLRMEAEAMVIPEYGGIPNLKGYSTYTDEPAQEVEFILQGP